MLFGIQKSLSLRAVCEAAQWFGKCIQASEEELKIVQKSQNNEDIVDAIDGFMSAFPKLFEMFIQKSPPRWPGQNEILESLGFIRGRAGSDLNDFMENHPLKLVQDFCIDYYVNGFVRTCRQMEIEGNPKGEATYNELVSACNAELRKYNAKEFLSLIEDHFNDRILLGILNPVYELDDMAAEPITVFEQQKNRALNASLSAANWLSDQILRGVRKFEITDAGRKSANFERRVVAAETYWRNVIAEFIQRNPPKNEFQINFLKRHQLETHCLAVPASSGVPIEMLYMLCLQYSASDFYQECQLIKKRDGNDMGEKALTDIISKIQKLFDESGLFKVNILITKNNFGL
jgi:hypothetical protein